MLSFGQNVLLNPRHVITSAHIVQEELPKRLARRLLDLQFLPHVVVTNPHIRTVYNAYFHAFHTLRRLPRVKSLDDNAHLTAVLDKLIAEHAPMLDELAMGLRECQQKAGMQEHVQLEPFLDSMLRSRISRRVMAEQHVHLLTPRPHHVGIINTNIAVRSRQLRREAVDFAAARTRQLCAESYGVAPDVLVTGDVRARLPQVAAHIDYILYELLKNAMRAVVERHRAAPALPPVRVRICDGQGMVTMRISDEGGGLPQGLEGRVWEYGFTTIPHTLHGESAAQEPAESAERLAGAGLGDLMQPASGAAGKFKMAGLGFGLPMARLHARFFGGDLQLVNLPGYGVDAFLSLRHLEEWEWSERGDDDAAGRRVVTLRGVTQPESL